MDKLPMLLHATVNTIGAGLIFPLFSSQALLVLWWVYGAIWLGAGFIALVLVANEKPVTPV